ncbi:ankyrin repeat and fibronectin type-III domain-containing protein 1-like isoform X3 [Patiria miniata]|uniref:Ankyrin repeat and fibronectin type-III domain-containing protein 1 n=1 Tax=Patiria miniata TaxID=46514 RepID=A0A914ATS5_PATMI|nr:ankyrin repeat and fibronectin type-III domain-containing protein 1-like isoform X3 [Patiria miniata]
MPDLLSCMGRDSNDFSAGTHAMSFRRKKNKRPVPPTITIGAAWRLEDDETRNPPPSPSIEDTPFARATSQPYYAVPPKFNDDEKSSRSNGGSGLVKLARRLSQKGDRRENKGDKPPCRQRSISVDSGDVRKAHSMENLLQQTSDYSKASSIPPSPTAPQKLHRSWSAKKRSGSNTEVDGGVGGGKDRTKRYSKQMTDSQALFDAVEHQDLDTARLILETNGLDVNQVNEDEFTALDIAVMTNNMPMARLLLTCGARENPRFLMKDARASKLNTLINEAEIQVQEMTSRIVNTGLNSATGPTGSSKDLEKHLRDWEWRFRLLKRMKAGFEHARVPDHPACVMLSTASSTSLQVRFEEPLNANGAAVTRYKIEWSCSEDLCPLAGEHILYDVRYPSYRIHGLRQGVKYYVRVSAFNMKGFGPSQTPTPPFAIPSSWRDMHGNKSRFSGRLNMIDDLFQQVRDTRPTDSGEIKRSSPRASPNQVRRTVKKSLKNFFQSAPKFQKHLKRGVYLASVMYNDDKVLVTNEDQLPIVEVDETFSSSIHQDFLWFLKVAGTWEDVDLLRSDLERTSGSSPAILFRARLLQAASLLQSALGTQDLGQVFYEPMRDKHGIIIITIINQIRDQRVIQTTSSLKWTNINRIQKRKSINMDNPSAAEMLLASLHEKILYHQVSGIKLTKGLYIGFLKLRSSVDTIRVQVPEKLPSVLPHIKLRDNPNVSQEEWEWLHTLDNCQSKRNPTKIQEEFQHLLAAGTRKLLVKMGVTEEESLTYRLCDLEVIEMNEQVSVVLLFPPSGSVCLGPGTSDEWMVSKDYISIPVPVFEMVHMTTYQAEFIRRFTRLSSILEIDSLIAQQTLREAFSSNEVNDAKQRQQQVLDYQQELETTWKGMRWIMDVLQYARDKQLRGGVPLSVLYAPPPSPVDSPMDVINDMETIFDDRCSLQIPDNAQTQPIQSLNLSKDSKPSTGILRVFPDYNSGLAKGTSIKLHVTSKTTCREIVNLVIQQLNKAVESHGLDSPLYLEDQWSEFCLVAIISNKEYQLRDDHCPLQLQNPWTKGHLYVRTKDNGSNLLSTGPSTAV